MDSRKLQILQEKAKAIRKDILHMLVPQESHHIGCALDIVEIFTTLYFQEMHVNSVDSKDPTRDICILSKGHAASALYATLYEKGFFSRELLHTYDRDGGTLPEHASCEVPGVEFSTGSLGHGLPVANGMALSYLRDKKTNKVFCILSDGELNEGSNWEAFMFAGHHKISNLTVIVDMNGFQGYSTTEKVIDLFPLPRKLQEFRWDTHEVDGHDFKQLVDVFKKIKVEKIQKPHIIFAKTIKGKGVASMEGKFEAHYKSISAEQKQQLLKDL